MNYLIEYDTRKIIHKCENDIEMDTYVEEHDLGKYAGRVSDADDILLVFSELEMANIYKALTGKQPKYSDEENLSVMLWGVLTSANIGPAKTEVKVGPKKSTNPRVVAQHLDPDTELEVLEPKCRAGSILSSIVKAIEEEMCSTVGEVTEYIVENHLQGKEQHPVDEKFAIKNIKYFIKKGSIGEF